MKTIVVYYSLDGNCSFISGEIKALIDADLIQLHTIDEKKRGKFGKFLWGGGMVFRRIKPPLKPYAFDPSAYDLIIIGAPVWAGSPAPPVHTFICETGIKGKKIALFACHGGGMGKALDKLKAMLPDNEIISTADFMNPADNCDKAKRQIADWVKGFEGQQQ